MRQTHSCLFLERLFASGNLNQPNMTPVRQVLITHNKSFDTVLTHSVPFDGKYFISRTDAYQILYHSNLNWGLSSVVISFFVPLSITHVCLVIEQVHITWTSHQSPTFVRSNGGATSAIIKSKYNSYQTKEKNFIFYLFPLHLTLCTRYAGMFLLCILSTRKNLYWLTRQRLGQTIYSICKYSNLFPSPRVALYSFSTS